MDQTPSRAAGSSLPAVVDVDLGDRSYPIYIGSGLLNQPDLLQRDPRGLAYAIKRSCQNKAEVVSLDEKEGGLRATLNLGHTFGHVDKKIADGHLRLVLLKDPLGSCVFG